MPEILDAPDTIKTTRDLDLWSYANGKPGDTIVVHQLELERTLENSYPGAPGANLPPVPLRPQGMTFRSSNPFDPKTHVKLTVPDGVNDDWPMIEPRSAQGADGIWYGGWVMGFDAVGGNSKVENVTWVKYAYGQHGIWFNDDRPYANLCGAVFCGFHNLYGDGANGPGTVLASSIYDIGRHGFTMTSDQGGATLQHCKVSKCRGRAWAVETGHLQYGIQILDNTFLEDAGYLSARVAPSRGYDYGFRYARNHSTIADSTAAGATGVGLTTWEYDGRVGYPDATSYGIEIIDNVFEQLGDHVKQKMRTPGVILTNVCGATVTGNKMIGLGAPVETRHNCKLVVASNNDIGKVSYDATGHAHFDGWGNVPSQQVIVRP